MSTQTRASSIRSSYANPSVRIRSNNFNTQLSSTMPLEENQQLLNDLYYYENSKNGCLRNGNKIDALTRNSSKSNRNSKDCENEFDLLLWKKHNFKPLHPHVGEFDDQSKYTAMEKMNLSRPLSVNELKNNSKVKIINKVEFKSSKSKESNKNNKYDSADDSCDTIFNKSCLEIAEYSPLTEQVSEKI